MDRCKGAVPAWPINLPGLSSQPTVKEKDSVKNRIRRRKKKGEGSKEEGNLPAYLIFVSVAVAAVKDSLRKVKDRCKGAYLAVKEEKRRRREEG